MGVVLAHVPVAGSYSSALASAMKLPDRPPVTSTLPSGSWAAAGSERAACSEPVAENERVAGLYSSALARLPPVTVGPPAISTLPPGSRVAAKCSRAEVIGPVGVHASGPPPYPVTGTPCGLRGALSDTETVAVRREVDDGANRTATVHVPPGGTGAPAQPVCTRKSPPPATSTQPLGSSVAAWPACLAAMEAVGNHAHAAGSYSSAVEYLNCEQQKPPSLSPPATSTSPPGSSVALCCSRAPCIDPVCVHLPVAGLYSSAAYCLCKNARI